MYIFNKKNSLVVCTAPKKNANISIIFDALNQQNIKSYYLSISYKEYKDLKINEKNNTLCVIFPNHWQKVFNSKLIISSHSIIFHSFLNIFTNIYTIHSGHGIRTGSLKNNQKQFKRYYYKFSEMWLVSELEKEIYIELGYEKNNQIIVGYPSIEKIINSNLSKQIKKTFLVAPTSYEFKNKIKSDFDIENINFLKLLESIAVKKELDFIIKPHWKTQLNNDIAKYIKNSKSLKLANDYGPKDYLQLLSQVDVLITDWSGIYVDFLILQKPIVFVNNIPPKDIHSFTKVMENNIIKRLETLDKFEEEIIKEEYSTNIANLKKFVFGDLKFETITENIINRVKKIIMNS